MHDRRIKVEGCSFSTTQLTIKNAFEDIGDVKDVDRVKDADNNCVFYVTFENDGDAEIAVEKMNGQDINGDIVSITFEGGNRKYRQTDNQDKEEDDDADIYYPESKAPKRFNSRPDKHDFQKFQKNFNYRTPYGINKNERRESNYSNDKYLDKKSYSRHEEKRDYSPEPRKLSQNVQDMYDSLVRLLMQYKLQFSN
ncbi:hypothetical protein TVAG_159930 [Trichomonas vaginalis G3]|uniref:RRM domain-containing protein n=1 Tax=Trichomonas vaginalis (strain ATCC PRA-98 / G3) TaxID=412133 RepID=A2DUT5_TRIV3|nr:RNA-binding domain, RBD family-containing protein [Trichomonas vaginalis G3]EAY15820.1 hypothetical protein TVAG_159930 [Trichomonas vaginalis G3]KAI5525009.1 RNA-binding domain, RBD family-containing protein [Trichomonas vaginalis G3]|eukprot:XP_001328043.1 hypothetical protein [Trichomonas vaginalis G3]